MTTDLARRLALALVLLLPTVAAAQLDTGAIVNGVPGDNQPVLGVGRHRLHRGPVLGVTDVQVGDRPQLHAGTRGTIASIRISRSRPGGLRTATASR